LAEVKTSGKLEIIRTYDQTHVRWLGAQLITFLLCLALGIVGLVVGKLAVGIICLIGASVLAFVALWLPGWRDRVEEHR
jgi:uncharacterized membrane protein